MKKTFTRIILASAALLLTQGCQWADDLGRHMPVIGERCENWQCFTSSGQAQSEANKRTLAGQGSEQKRKPINPQYQPQQQEVPQAPVEAQPEKGRTPFDMSPEELNDMPGTPSY